MPERFDWPFRLALYIGRWTRATAVGSLSSLSPARADDELRRDDRLVHRHERGHDGGVELCSRTAGQLLERLLLGLRHLVGTVLGHRVEGVGDEDDPRAERDRLPAEAVRVAEPIPALVGGADQSPDRTQ